MEGQRAILSLSPENFLTIWLMALGLYLITALFVQVFGRLGGGFGVAVAPGNATRPTAINTQSGM